MPLETVDLTGVEIMSAGVRVHGKGSPPEGDLYDVAALERLAADTNAVLDQVKPFVKLGHNSEQRLLKAEGFYDGDDQPQTGRLENLRVDGTKLVTDLKGVPRKLADLITSKAFPSRSTEIVLHQDADLTKREIVGRLAFLGAKPAAFKNLADVAALYADQPVDEEDIKVVEHADRGFSEVPDAIFAVFAAALAGREVEKPADTADRMPDQPNPLRSFAEAVGLDGDPSEAQILESLRGLVAEADAAKKRAEAAEGKATEYAEQIQALEPRIKAGEDAAKQLHDDRRERIFEEAIREFRLAPADVDDDLRADYDANPDTVKRLISKMAPRADLTRSFGADATPSEAEAAEAEGLALFPAPGKAAV